MGFKSHQLLVKNAALQALEKGDSVVMCFDKERQIHFIRSEFSCLLIGEKDHAKIAVFAEQQWNGEVDALLNSNEGTTVKLGLYTLAPVQEGNEVIGVLVYSEFPISKYDSILLAVSELVASSKDAEAIVHQFMGLVTSALGNASMFVAPFDSRRSVYDFTYSYNVKKEEIDFDKILVKDSFFNFVRISGKPILIQNGEFREYSKEFNIQPIGERPVSWLGVPIMHTGKSIGVVVVQSYNKGLVFDKVHLNFLTRVANYLSQLVYLQINKQREQRYKDIQGIVNTLTKVTTFEYSIKNDCFYSTSVISEVLNLNKENGAYKFNDFLIKIAKEDQVIFKENFLKFCSPSPDETTPVSEQFECELYLSCSSVVLKFCAFRVHDASDLIIGFMQDITLVKQNKKVMKLALDKVKQADRLKSEFMVALSYEARTPINAIIGFSNLMIKPHLTEPEKNSYHRIVRQNGDALIRLIDEMVDVSRIESGEVKIHMNPTNLNRLLDNVLVFSNKRIAESKKPNIEVILHKSHKNMVLLADEGRLAQIINTLISNAISFTSKGYIQFGYHIIDREQPLIEFFVKDTGTGIPTEKQGMLFDRYGKMEGDKVVRPGATSLGLSISKDLVRLMGGEMTVESKPNKGTTFYFYLPYLKVEDVGDNQTPKHFYVQAPNRIIQILVAEDDISTFKLIEESFVRTKMKVEFEFASNGLEAIEKLRLQQYDILLMDLKMPLMDGVKTAEYIRKKLPSPQNNTPIIALTANAMQETRRQCLEIGFNGFITKPFMPEDLVSKVNEVIN